MTDAQKHAARLRSIEEETRRLGEIQPEDRAQCMEESASLLAGANALEAQGRWHLHVFRGKRYMVPADKWNEWCTWEENVEPGEYTELMPEWAKSVPENVVITGWVRP